MVEANTYVALEAVFDEENFESVIKIGEPRPSQDRKTASWLESSIASFYLLMILQNYPLRANHYYPILPRHEPHDANGEFESVTLLCH